MSITTGQLTIGTTAVQIDGNDVNPVMLKVHNLDATKQLFIGGANVTTANGYVLDKGEQLDFTLPAGESIFMISSGNNHQISWMKVAHY
jgi:hypothetical protein